LQNAEVQLLQSYLASPSAHQIYMAAAIVSERYAAGKSNASDTLAEQVTTLLLGHFDRPRPATYSEMNALLKRIQADCQALMQAFNVEAKVSKDRIPSIPSDIDPLNSSPSSFSLATAQLAISSHFDALTKLMSKHATKNVLPALKDRQMRIMISVGKYGVMKERYDTQVMAGIGGALVALQTLPTKIGPVVKAIMDSVKVRVFSPGAFIERADTLQKEEIFVLQSRSATSVAALIDLCSSPGHTGANPSDKVVKNLFTFLCQDTVINPIFKPTSEGILSLTDDKPKKAVKAGAEVDETEEQISMRIMRRGALAAFEKMAARFGADLVDRVPKFWAEISSPLTTAFEGAYTLRTTDTR
jgi:TATA-binding protein-associated factor